MNRMTAVILLTCAAMAFNVSAAVGQVDWNKRVVVDDKPKSWAELLVWLAAQSKASLDLNKHRLPPGTVTIVVPKDKMGRPRDYSLTEVFDLLNLRLQVDGDLALVRNGTTLTLVRVGRYPDLEPLLIPRVGVGELKDRPQTEIVDYSS